MTLKKHYSICTVLLFLAAILCMASCIKDEAANKECDINGAHVIGDEYAKYFSDKSKMNINYLSSTETNVVFEVTSLISLPKQIPVTFDITPGATIEPANGSMQDFTKGPVTYTVTSQDGEWQRHYKVEFKEPVLPTFTFSFEHVEKSKPTTGGNQYHIFYEIHPTTGARMDIWASGNEGASMIFSYKQPEVFPTYSTEQGYKNKGVRLMTIFTGEMGKAFKRPIAAGSLYFGKFDINKVLTDPLKSTQFGIPIDRVPVRVTGYYKYKPGAEFTDKDMHVIPGRIDEASIYAVLYKNKDSQGNDYFMYGGDVENLDNMLNNPQVIRVARATNLVPTDEWTRFEMFFGGKEVDTQAAKDKKYNVALVFSSSKSGAQFEGAVGSTLYVDEVEVAFEKEEQK